MKLYETLSTQLKIEPNFVTDNGELKKWVVINKVQNYGAEKETKYFKLQLHEGEISKADQ